MLGTIILVPILYSCMNDFVTGAIGRRIAIGCRLRLSTIVLQVDALNAARIAVAVTAATEIVYAALVATNVAPLPRVYVGLMTFSRHKVVELESDEDKEGAGKKHGDGFSA